MKKLGKMLPLFLLVCMLTFAAGCGSDKNNKNQDDMAGNSTTTTESLPQSSSPAGENDTLAGTEAFEGTNTDDGSLNNSVTDPGTDNTVNHPDDVIDTVPGNTENGNVINGTENGTKINGTENGTVSSTENGKERSTVNGTEYSKEHSAVDGKDKSTVKKDGDKAGRTAGNAVDDIGNTVGNVIDDAGNAVKNVADDVGDGVKDLTDSKR